MHEEKEIIRRPIRSYVRREGRITPAQEDALENLWPLYGLNVSDGQVDIHKIFDQEAPLVLEIGFGNGESLFKMAEQEPQVNFIGIEVYRPGVGNLLKKVHENKLSNIHIFCEDAVTVLKQSIPDNSLDRVQIFFPDPWPKKRHHKRRLIQKNFLALVQTKMKTNGVLHIATDWENYAEHIMQVVRLLPDFIDIATEQKCHYETLRPKTKFETRGQRLGHEICDLVFEKQL